MYIYILSFTNQRIINGCELPCFYDFKIMSNRFYQYNYISFFIQFLKSILFLGWFHIQPWLDYLFVYINLAY